MVSHVVSGRNVSVLGPSFAIVSSLGLPRSVSFFHRLDRSSPNSLAVGTISGFKPCKWRF